MTQISRIINGLQPSAAYTVQVRSKNSDGEYSDWSNSYNFSTPADGLITNNSTVQTNLTGFAAIVAGAGGGINLPGGPSGTMFINSSGLKAYDPNGLQTVFISSSTGDALFRGSIYANAGAIGGFTIQNNKLSSSVSQSEYVGVSGSGLYAFWAGNPDPAQANFSVTNTGSLIARAATISVANIGGFTLTPNSLYAGQPGSYVGLVPNSLPFFAGANDSNGTGARFSVTNSGSVYANAASLAGPLISDSVLTGTQTVTGAIVGAALYVPTSSNWKFRVTPEGYMSAANASVSGSITANYGQIGGWSISDTRITTGAGSTRIALDSSSTTTSGPAIWIGYGNKGSMDTPFYADSQGNFSLGSQLTFTPGTGTSAIIQITGYLNGNNFIVPNSTTASSIAIQSEVTGTAFGPSTYVSNISYGASTTFTLSKSPLYSNVSTTANFNSLDYSELSIKGKISGIVESVNPVSPLLLSTYILNAVVSTSSTTILFNTSGHAFTTGLRLQLEGFTGALAGLNYSTSLTAASVISVPNSLQFIINTPVPYPPGSYVLTNNTSGQSIYINNGMFGGNSGPFAGFIPLSASSLIVSSTSTYLGYTDIYGNIYYADPVSSIYGTSNVVASIQELTMGFHPTEGAPTQSWYHTGDTGIRLNKYNWWFVGNQFRVGNDLTYFKWNGTQFLIQGGSNKKLLFQVSKTDSENLIAITSNTTASYNDPNTPFYVNGSGAFSLGNQLTWDGTTLTVNGQINVSSSISELYNRTQTLNASGQFIAPTTVIQGGAIYAGKPTYGSSSAGWFMGYKTVQVQTISGQNPNVTQIQGTKTYNFQEGEFGANYGTFGGYINNIFGQTQSSSTQIYPFQGGEFGATYGPFGGYFNNITGQTQTTTQIVPVLDIGNDTNYVRWDGNSLQIAGQINVTGGNALTTTTGDARYATQNNITSINQSIGNINNQIINVNGQLVSVNGQLVNMNGQLVNLDASGNIQLPMTVLQGGAVYAGKPNYGSSSAGWFIGYRAISLPGITQIVPAFDIGNASSYFRWDGYNVSIAGNASVTGVINATSGSIGGWTVDTNNLYASNSGSYYGMYLGTGNNVFFAGATDNFGTNGKFTVNANGNLYATGASVIGTVNAQSGSIGGWAISSNSISSTSGSAGTYLFTQTVPTASGTTIAFETSYKARPTPVSPYAYSRTGLYNDNGTIIPYSWYGIYPNKNGTASEQNLRIYARTPSTALNFYMRGNPSIQFDGPDGNVAGWIGSYDNGVVSFDSPNGLTGVTVQNGYLGLTSTSTINFSGPTNMATSGGGTVLNPYTTGSGVVIYAQVIPTGYASTIIRTTLAQAGDTSSSHILCRSNLNVSDNANNNVFRVRGDGATYTNNGSITGNADYAEMFEWYDGNANGEDRVGYSVELLEEKIVIAQTSSSNIIGIISANPSVLGDAAWNKWKNQYLTDDFGREILENIDYYKWVDVDGETKTCKVNNVPQNLVVPENAEIISMKEPVMNPDFDPNLEYVPREQRKEWSPVGLLGKLYLRKGQPVNPNWIKLKDISDNVEQWLVK
jgi:hypothetical protein